MLLSPAFFWLLFGCISECALLGRKGIGEKYEGENFRGRFRKGREKASFISFAIPFVAFYLSSLRGVYK
jgi:hypothetical protein